MTYQRRVLKSSAIFNDTAPHLQHFPCSPCLALLQPIFGQWGPLQAQYPSLPPPPTAGPKHGAAPKLTLNRKCTVERVQVWNIKTKTKIDSEYFLKKV